MFRKVAKLNDWPRAERNAMLSQLGKAMKREGVIDSIHANWKTAYAHLSALEPTGRNGRDAHSWAAACVESMIGRIEFAAGIDLAGVGR